MDDKITKAIEAISGVISSVARSLHDAYFYADEVVLRIAKNLEKHHERVAILRAMELAHIRNPAFSSLIVDVRNRKGWELVQAASVGMLEDVDALLARLRGVSVELIGDETYGDTLRALSVRKILLAKVLSSDFPARPERESLADQFMASHDTLIETNKRLADRVSALRLGTSAVLPDK